MVDVAPPIDADNRCHGTGIVNVCLDPPTDPVMLPTTLDTDDSGLCVPFTSTTGTIACVIAGTSISLAGALVVRGGKPLVLVSTSTIEIASGATLDLSSRRSPRRVGAGGNSDGCVASTPSVGGGGGAGGTFGGLGGDGSDKSGGGAGGVAAAVTTVTSLRGGCSGASGSQTGTIGGPGGGAVFLIAKTQISIGGTINASGAAGGYPGVGGLPVQNSGGGGGGSGGMIGLDAPTIMIDGNVFANGGGGAEGQSSFVGDNGDESTGPTDIGDGGGGVSSAGNGGPGASGTNTSGGDGTMATSGDGGGGGGGGAGVILLFPSQATGTNVAPPPS